MWQQLLTSNKRVLGREHWAGGLSHSEIRSYLSLCLPQVKYQIPQCELFILKDGAAGRGEEKI